MKHLLKGTLLACVISVLLSALFLTTAEAKTDPSFLKAFSYRFGPYAGGPSFRSLDGVAAVSASNVWAVGSFTGRNSSIETLIEHWNGTHWSIIGSPNPGAIFNGLAAISAISATDIWAVGSFSKITNTSQTLIEHWNGTQWSVVNSPNPMGTMNNTLNGIAAISTSNIWAVGSSSASNTISQTLIEHWNGTQWSIVTSPNRESQDGLNAVAAVTANNIWAVGSFSRNSSSAQTLIEHWNGSTWSIVTSPSPGSGVVTLVDVAVVSSTNIWAVGSSHTFSTTLTEHWNGTAWSAVTSPNPSQIDLLIGVAAISSGNVWAIGQALAQNGQTLSEHWNGTQWSVVNSPNQPGSANNFLLGIDAISASDIWAVGGFQSSNLAEHTLTEHWNGSMWSIVPSP